MPSSLVIKLPVLVSAVAVFFLASADGYAQIYKWVDGNGVTHYSEKKEHTTASKTEQLNIQSKPSTTPSTTSTTSSADYWQDQDRQFKQRQLENATKIPEKPAVAARPRSVSGGRSDDTAVSKCNLARDVLNGSLRHSNGAPVDKYDLETAANDVKAFCR